MEIVEHTGAMTYVLSRREFLASSAAMCAAPEPKAPVKLPGLDDLPTEHEFKSSKALVAAISLQGAGREAAIKHLVSLANTEEVVKQHEAALKAKGLTGDRLEMAVGRAASKEFLKRQDIILLCRMLFTAKPGSKFRRPAIGGPAFVGARSMPEWPLEPIEIVDGVPFLVVMGYLLGGLPERAEDYLDYCIKNCEWNATQYKPKSAVEKKNSLEKLIAFLKHGGKVEEQNLTFLRNQIK